MLWGFTPVVACVILWLNDTSPCGQTHELSTDQSHCSMYMPSFVSRIELLGCRISGFSS